MLCLNRRSNPFLFKKKNSTEKFGFTPVNKENIKSFGEKEYNKKNFKVPTQIISNSPYKVEKNGSHYVLSSLGKSCYSIAQISLKEGENVDIPTINIYPYVLKETKSLPFEQYPKTESSAKGYEIDRNLPQIINAFDNELPETYLLFTTLITALKNFCEKKGLLNQAVFSKFFGKLLEDPILKLKQEANLPLMRGIIELFQIFNLRGENELRKRIQNLCLEINYTPIERLEKHKVWYEKVTKLALSNNAQEKAQFVDIAEMLLKKRLASEETLKLGTSLRIDRIFQRNLVLKDYHNPLFDEMTHRWFTEDISNLINLDLKVLELYASELDIGILRDLCTAFGELFAWTSQQEKSSEGSLVEGVRFIPISEIDQDGNFWQDTERDKLSSAGSQREAIKNLAISVEVASKENHKKITDILVLFLSEIARREGIKPQEITGKEKRSVVDSSAEKWFDLSESHPDIWHLVAKSFGYEVPSGSEQRVQRNEHSKVADKQDLKEQGETQGSADKHFSQLIDNERGNEKISKGNAIDGSSQDKKPNQATRPSTQIDIKEMNMHLESSSNKEFKDSPALQKSPELSIQLSQDKIKIEPPREEKNKVTPKRELALNSSMVGLKPRSMIESTLVTRSLKKRISYHSLRNLQEAHRKLGNNLKNAQFCLTPSGSEICCQLPSKQVRCKLFIYETESNMLLPIYLERDQMKSLCIWNSAAYLFLDKQMAERFTPTQISKNLENCLLYSDLTQAFEESGETKGIIAFVPMLKNSDNVSNRAVIADDDGIFIVGGLMKRNNKRNPIIPTGYCNYYEIKNLPDLGTEVVEGYLDTMEIKRHDAIVAQTTTRLFVTERTNENSADKSTLKIEVFDKEDFSWIYAFEIPTHPEFTSYSLSQIKVEDKQMLIVIGHKFGKYSTGYVIDVNRIEQQEKDDYIVRDGIEKAIKKIDKLNLKDNGMIVAMTGFENLQILNNYSEAETLSIGDFKREAFEVILFDL